MAILKKRLPFAELVKLRELVSIIKIQIQRCHVVARP
jgi:hypothetical protein